MRFQDIPQIKKSYYRVNIPWGYLDFNLERYVEDYNLDLNPEFQRGHVWTETQQIAYVEWILRGGESGREILFNYPGWPRHYNKESKMVLVDGLQRITAARKFMYNELPVFGGIRFNDFENECMSFEYDFIFYVGGYTKYSDILQWYLDINSGGTPHAQSEIDRVAEMLKKIKQEEK